VELLKPVLTGYPSSDSQEVADCDVLLQASGLAITDSARDRMSPWRYRQPLSPDMAAAQQGESVPFERLCEFCAANETDGIRIIEGIGGVMVPLDPQHTVLDWISALHIPAILVAGSYLGTLSHTLTAVASLEHREIPLLGIVVSESVDNPVELATTCATLKNFCSAPIVAIPRLTGADAWRRAPDLTGLLGE
jgi:dethiobiotin synthetase